MTLRIPACSAMPRRSEDRGNRLASAILVRSLHAPPTASMVVSNANVWSEWRLYFLECHQVHKCIFSWMINGLMLKMTISLESN